MIPSYSYFALILFLFIAPSLSLSNSSSQFIHPIFPSIMPGKRNFSSHYLPSIQPSNHEQPPLMANPNNKKRLRRLPHVFSKVLELPFDSDADVYVKEYPDCFKFIAQAEDGEVVDGGFRAHVVEYHPGITKIVIRRRDDPSQPTIDELQLDVWRFRLPPSARPELATAVYANGQLVVTVPKNGWSENNRRGGDCTGGFKGNMGNLILVQ